jgi:hypothetical protein
MTAYTLLVLIGGGMAALFLSALLEPRSLWNLDLRKGLLRRLGDEKYRLLRAIKSAQLAGEDDQSADPRVARRVADLKPRAIEVMKLLDRARDVRRRRLESAEGSRDPALEKHIERLVAERKEKL